MTTPLPRLLVSALLVVSGVGCTKRQAQVVPAVVPAPTQVPPEATLPASSNLRLEKAKFHHEALWLIGRTGPQRKLLLMYRPGAQAVEVPMPDEDVIDIHRSLDDRLWILSQKGGDVRVWERTENGFSILLELERPTVALAISEWRGRPVILTENRVLFVGENGALHVTSIEGASKRRPKCPEVFAVTHTGTVYVGRDCGEWGGELFRFPIWSGKVTIPDYEWPEDKRGRLPRGNYKAVMADPDDESCVLLGLSTFSSPSGEGRLDRICERGWQPMIFRPEQLPSRQHPLKPCADGERSFMVECTDLGFRTTDGAGVTGLERTRNGYWMHTMAASYFVRAGRLTRFDFPKREEVSGYGFGQTQSLLFAVRDFENTRRRVFHWPLAAAIFLDDPTPPSP